MKYIVDVSEKHAVEIQKFLDSGSYSSFTQFISAAVENQILLELSEVGKMTQFALKPESESNDDLLKHNERAIEKNNLSNIPIYKSVFQTPEFKNLVFASQKIPEHQIWIWGQINKIFPIKLGVRVLHQMLAANSPVELSEFLENATLEAVKYGEMIRAYEKQEKKIRGEKISAALPTKDEKSRTRYKFQFLVYPRKDGLLDGAMAVMRFCNVYTERKRQWIGITEQGLNFSCIENPVLDKNSFDYSLSREESIFYLNNAKTFLSGEFEAIRWILIQIENKNNERETLNSSITEAFGSTWKATSAVVNTQRAGLMARMYELGLIDKDKHGIYVKYRVSDWGKEFLKNANN